MLPARSLRSRRNVLCSLLACSLLLATGCDDNNNDDPPAAGSGRVIIDDKRPSGSSQSVTVRVVGGETKTLTTFPGRQISTDIGIGAVTVQIGSVIETMNLVDGQVISLDYDGADLIRPLVVVRPTSNG